MIFGIVIFTLLILAIINNMLMYYKYYTKYEFDDKIDKDVITIYYKKDLVDKIKPELKAVVTKGLGLATPNVIALDDDINYDAIKKLAG